MSVLAISMRPRPRRVPLTLLVAATGVLLPGSAGEAQQLIAALGPPGPAGPPGSGSLSRFDVSSAATWIVPHELGRAPIAQVFLASGEHVLPDITVDDVHITVTFSSPTAGFVLAS